MGAAETENERVILQLLHPEVAESCQLAMGYTRFAEGSVRTMMPAHTHDRRMEACLCFDMPSDRRVFHLMGEPDRTRHIQMTSEEAATSPPRSIHAGGGTGSCTFCRAMAGDSVDFTDMDMIPHGSLQ